MMRLQGEKTLAILLGASEWPNYLGLHGSPAFENSARDLRAYLQDKNTLAVPDDHILWLFDDESSPPRIDAKIRNFLRDHVTSGCTDLILYYTGHGRIAVPDRKFQIILRTTDREAVSLTAYGMEDLANSLNQFARRLRKWIFLDCCSSAAAYGDFQPLDSDITTVMLEETEDKLPRQGTALYCASSADQVAFAPQGSNYTMFSGALIEVLQSGSIDLQELMTLRQIAGLVQSRIFETYPDKGVRPHLSSPEQREGDITSIRCFPNPLKVGPAPQPSPLRELWKRILSPVPPRDLPEVIGWWITKSLLPILLILVSFATGLLLYRDISKAADSPPFSRNFSPAQAIPFYQNSYALVIGIDAYPLPAAWSVPVAASDAEAMTALLQEQGFTEIALFTNERATKGAIVQKLQKWAPLLTREDRVLVVFIGHGHTEKHSHADVGYLDFYNDSSEGGQGMTLQELQEFSHLMGKAKHQLFMIDASIAGMSDLPRHRIYSQQSGSLEEVTPRVARQLLIANASQQRGREAGKAGNTSFVQTLLQGLRAASDVGNGDCYIQLHEIVDYFAARGVPPPRVNYFPEHDQGEFIFSIKNIKQEIPSEEVASWLSDPTKSLCGLDLRQVDLRGHNLHLQGRDFREANLHKVRLQGVNLSRADLRWARLAEAELGEAVLNNADLRWANLQKANLSKAMLINADLGMADLIEANLQHARLERARLNGALLHRADMNKANLEKADLRGAVLRKTKMSGVELRRANVAQVVYEPEKGFRPTFDIMRHVDNLAKMTYQVSPNALRDLRQAFENNNMFDERRQVDIAIKRNPPDGLWQRLPHLFKFGYFFQELTCQYDLSPGRPLLLILLSDLILITVWIVGIAKRNAMRGWLKTGIWLALLGITGAVVSSNSLC